MSDIDTEVVGSLKVLDPRRPIREADIDGGEIPQCSGVVCAIVWVVLIRGSVPPL